MWALRRSVVAAKQTAVIACHVDDRKSKAKGMLMRLDKTKLSSDGGLTIVLDALAEHYKLDATLTMFLAIEALRIWSSL